MKRFALAPQFLKDFRSLETGMGPGDAECLYDPTRTTWLRRTDAFMIHYAVDVERDEVVFLNVFRRR